MREERNNEQGAQRRGLWVIPLNLAVIAVIAFLEFGRGARPERPGWLLAAACCFGVMLGAETLKYACLLRAVEHPQPVHTGFRCAVLGKYFDNITPAGFGGQPFQIHYLSTHGCSDGVSGALPVLGFLGLQFSFITLALAVFLFGSRVFSDELTVRLVAWAGLGLYSFVPVCVLLFSVAPRLLVGLVRGGTGLLRRLHILKDADRAANRAIDALEAYTASVRRFRRRPRVIIAAALLSFAFRASLLSMPWFVLRAFGAQVPFLRCFCKIVYIYAVIALIPTPGNTGAAEASFYTVFSTLPTGNVFWAMLVWRLLCYYSWLICGATYYIGRAARRKYTDRADGS